MKGKINFYFLYFNLLIVTSCYTTRKSSFERIAGIYHCSSKYYGITLKLFNDSTVNIKERTDLIQYEMLGTWKLEGDSIFVYCKQKIYSSSDLNKHLPFVSHINDSTFTTVAFFRKRHKLTKIYPGIAEVFIKE